MEDCNTMEDSCRACTKKDEDMRSIFEEPERLYDELQYCTGLVITEGDGLPSKICNSCLKDLKVAHKFKTSCLQADKTFKWQKNTLIKTEIQEYDSDIDCNSAEECTEDMFVGNSLTENSGDVKLEVKLETGNVTGDIKTENKVKNVTRKSETNDYEEDTAKTTENELEDFESEPSGSLCKVECNLCNKTFKTKALYAVHNRTVHKKELDNEIKSDDKIYQCTQCPLTFATAPKRHAHIRRMHSKLLRYKCRICGQGFVRNVELGQHMDLEHGVKWHTCHICERTFTRRDSLRKHLLKQHDIYMLPSSCRCRQCSSGHPINHHSNNQNQATNINSSQTMQGQGPSMMAHDILTLQSHNEFTSQSHNDVTSQAHNEVTLQAHTEITSQTRKEITSQAHKEITSQTHQEITSQAHTVPTSLTTSPKKEKAIRTKNKLSDVKSGRNLRANRIVECVLCKIIFNSEKLYAAHNKKVHKMKSYTCEVCGKAFSNRSSQNAHKLLHKESKFHCDECDYITLIKSYMVKHMQRLHQAKRKPVIKNPKKDKVATEIDKDKKDEVATEIDKDKKDEVATEIDKDKDVKSVPKFRRSYGTHKTTVHGVKCYVCEICGKVSKHQSSHSVHKRIHGDPRFHCNDCDYKTCNKQDMVKHMRVHSGIKNYSCPQCPLTFSTSSNRIAHIRRAHIKLPRFYCHVCGRGFLEKYGLGAHLDSHQGIKRHECEVCQTKFAQIKHLKRHLLKQHNVRLPPGSNRRRQYASLQSINHQSNKQDQSSNKNSSRITQDLSITAHNTLTSQAHNELTSQYSVLTSQAHTVPSHMAQTLSVCAHDGTNSYYVPE